MVLEGLTISNGLGWSPDGQTMYLVDSGPRVVHAFSFDGDGGTISAGRVLVTVPEDIGAPDGMTVDAAGDLWVAIYGGGRVNRYAPDGSLARCTPSRPGSARAGPSAAPACTGSSSRTATEGLDRRAAPLRSGRRPGLPGGNRCHRPAGRAVPSGPGVVGGLHPVKGERPSSRATNFENEQAPFTHTLAGAPLSRSLS